MNDPVLEIFKVVKKDVESIIYDVNWSPSGISGDDMVDLIEIKGSLQTVIDRIDRKTERKIKEK